MSDDEGRVMIEEQCLRALKGVARVIDTMEDPRALEREFMERLKMDPKAR